MDLEKKEYFKDSLYKRLLDVEDIKQTDIFPLRICQDRYVNILYGAGSNARSILNILQKNNIKVDYIFDDDMTRWGRKFEEFVIIDHNTFIRLIKSTSCNIIIASLYIINIHKKMSEFIKNIEFHDIKIFSMMSVIFENELYTIMSEKTNSSFLEKLKDVKLIFSDKQSMEICELAESIYKKENVEYWDKYIHLYCGEEQYFLNKFIKYLDTKILLDVGAYTGDSLQKAIDLNINFKQYICFEANPINFKLLTERVSNLSGEKKITCFNYALWNQEKDLTLSLEGFATKTLDISYLEGDVCHAVMLDSFIPKLCCDFLKMDIEGSELHALKGMEQMLINCRPILAISIYHSLNDFTDIPIYLNCILKNYTFFIKKHVLAFSETVLYGIPAEKKLHISSER